MYPRNEELHELMDNGYTYNQARYMLSLRKKHQLNARYESKARACTIKELQRRVDESRLYWKYCVAELNEFKKNNKFVRIIDRKDN